MKLVIIQQTCKNHPQCPHKGPIKEGQLKNKFNDKNCTWYNVDSCPFNCLPSAWNLSSSQKTADWDLDAHFKSDNHSLDMTSDMQKFIDLYKQFGIILTPETHKHGSSITIAVPDPEEETKESKIRGWDGFYTTLHFNENGKFLYQEIEE